MIYLKNNTLLIFFVLFSLILLNRCKTKKLKNQISGTWYSLPDLFEELTISNKLEVKPIIYLNKKNINSKKIQRTSFNLERITKDHFINTLDIKGNRTIKKNIHLLEEGFLFLIAHKLHKNPSGSIDYFRLYSRYKSNTIPENKTNTIIFKKSRPSMFIIEYLNPNISFSTDNIQNYTFESSIVKDYKAINPAGFLTNAYNYYITDSTKSLIEIENISRFINNDYAIDSLKKHHKKKLFVCDLGMNIYSHKIVKEKYNIQLNSDARFILLLKAEEIESSVFF